MSSPSSYQPIDLAQVRSQRVLDLSTLLAAKRADLFSARFAHSGGQRSKTHFLKQMRRDVARLSLVLSQKIKSERSAAGLANAGAAVESSNA